MYFEKKIISALVFGICSTSYAVAVEKTQYGSYQIIHTKNYDGMQDSLQSGDKNLNIATLSATSTAQEMRSLSLNEAVQLQGMGEFYAKALNKNPAGKEILAVYHSDIENQNTGFLLQIPASFNYQNACIVAVPETGSGKLYSWYDQLVHGVWGLNHNCAVVYTDKGQGNGIENISTGEVLKLDGTTTLDKKDSAVSFFLKKSPEALQQYNKNFPDRIGFKHANSTTNSDSHWGEDVVSSIEFAFSELNRNLNDKQKSLTNKNTTVLVYGSSNGGGASLKAGEFDRRGLIDGIVAVEPQIQPKSDDRINISTRTRNYDGNIKSLVDYFTWAIIWQPCASLDIDNAPMKDKVTYAKNSCTSLKEKGLLKSSSLAEQSKEALDNLHNYGWMSSKTSDRQQPMHFLIAPTATAQKYINSMGRFDISENLCGYSVAKVDANGKPIPADSIDLRKTWIKGYGGAPAGDIHLINNNNPDGAIKDDQSRSPSTGRQDYNLDGILCLRQAIKNPKVTEGYQSVVATGNLNKIPTIIVHGHDDVRVPVNFSSRPYLALNSLVEGEKSQLVYIEVENAGHFGAEKPFDDVLIPLDFYGEQAMDLMWNHLRMDKKLPLSQIIRTIPRGTADGKVNNLTRENIPSIKINPAVQDIIKVDNGKVYINEKE